MRVLKRSGELGEITRRLLRSTYDSLGDDSDRQKLYTLMIYDANHPVTGVKRFLNEWTSRSSGLICRLAEKF